MGKRPKEKKMRKFGIICGKDTLEGEIFCTQFYLSKLNKVKYVAKYCSNIYDTF